MPTDNGPRPLTRVVSLILCLMVPFATMPMPLYAGTYYWDEDTTPINNILGNGGSGLGQASTANILWDTTSQAWWPGSGAFNQAWNNANNDTAVFWGTAGTVNLGAAISVGGLTFNTNGYTIGSANSTNTLTFGGSTTTVTVDTLLGATGETITSQLAGSGSLVLTGGVYGGATAGTLTSNGTTFTWTGSYTGSTTINNGMTFALAGNSIALQSTSGITLNNGNVTLTNATASDAALNRVNDGAGITSNGGTFTVTNTASASINYAETVGAVALTSSNLNVIQTNANTLPAPCTPRALLAPPVLPPVTLVPPV